MDYVVVFEKSDTGWAAYVPDLPGVITSKASKPRSLGASEAKARGLLAPRCWLQAKSNSN